MSEAWASLVDESSYMACQHARVCDRRDKRRYGRSLGMGEFACARNRAHCVCLFLPHARMIFKADHDLGVVSQLMGRVCVIYYNHQPRGEAPAD